MLYKSGIASFFSWNPAKKLDLTILSLKIAVDTYVSKFNYMHFKSKILLSYDKKAITNH